MSTGQQSPEQLDQIISQYEQYLQVERGIAPSTCRLYLWATERFLKFCDVHQQALFLPLGWQLSDLGVREVEFYIRQQTEEQGVQYQTMVSVVTALRSFFRFLHTKGHLAKNPLSHFTLKPEILPAEKETIAEESLIALFSKPPEKTFESLRNRALLELCYGVGLSAAQLSQLQDVIPDHTTGHGVLVQSGQSREVPLVKEALEVLEEYRLLRQQMMEDAEGFWMGVRGKMMRPAQIAAAINESLSHAGIKEGVTALKNSASAHFAEHGADVRTLKRFRNLKRINSTEAFKQQEYQALVEQFRNCHLREET